MGLLFKTYNGKHQLHFYKELWVIPTKRELEEVLKILPKKEAAKARIIPHDKVIELELEGVIIDCRDIADLKYKFGLLVDMKEKFQKILPPKKPENKAK